MGFVLNYFLKGMVREFFLTKKIKAALRYIERTYTFQYVSHYTTIFWYRVRLLLLFISYQVQMQILAFSMWRLKFSVRSEAPGQIMVLHYNPYTCKDPEEIARKMARSVTIPFHTLHKQDPIVLILPNDQILQTGSIQGFLRSLNRDQRIAFQDELYKYRENQNEIEIIGS
ncbi:hypothetical protein [Leptospira kmetyi]|uniref:hypothetical protein n=1 Tax=Leptospira kmetyi TaxID=408139 RepID=UPI0002891898|nr:hypothetical protein [Leptospira kmetyi]